MFDFGFEVAKFYQKSGYRGFFDIDFVYGINGRLAPLESNLRRTGGTHVYELGKRLLGESFEKKYYLVANNICDSPKLKGKSFSEIKRIFSKLLYPIKEQKEGVILTIYSYLKMGKLGYVVIGKNKKKANKMELDFLKLL